MKKEIAAEWVSIDKLKKWKENPRDNTAAIPKVKDSIKRFGFASPIIARKADGTIIAGHTRYEAAKLLKLEKVPVRFMDLDPADSRLLALADNKIGEVADWDEHLLSEIIKSESFSMDDLNIAGFDLDSLDDFDEGPAEPENEQDYSEVSEHDRIPENVKPETKTGDIIEIGNHKLFCGDCVEVMKKFEKNSISCIVTDPPYGIDFMNSAWDSSIPDNEWASECLRILKPGGHLIAFAATRTFHRLGMVVENAGFEIRDTINWLYFSGFPKSHSVDKSLDSHFGVEREIIGYGPPKKTVSHCMSNSGQNKIGAQKKFMSGPKTKEAIQFEGYGTALKPSFEPAILARKPLSEKTIALNVLKWGTGSINIDGCRFGYGDPCWVGPQEANLARPINDAKNNIFGKYESFGNPNGSELGRWPANIYQCPKPSRSEREEGCDELPSKTGAEFIERKEDSKSFLKPSATEIRNIHPTVKPIKLMRWLCRLVMPPNEDAIVLDTFTGSGTTLVAAELEGFKSIGVEMNPEYCDIIKARLKTAVMNAKTT